MPDITLRAVRPEDDLFVLDVFTASHGEYDFLPLPPDQKKQLIELQYRLQTADYKMRFPDSRHEVILVDEEAAGRVWWALLEEEIRIIDMGLLATARNSGVGTVIMKRFQQEARKCNKPLRSSVLRFNQGSLRWHERLNFRVEREDELMLYLEWRAD